MTSCKFDAKSIDCPMKKANYTLQVRKIWKLSLKITRFFKNTDTEVRISKYCSSLPLSTSVQDKLLVPHLCNWTAWQDWALQLKLLAKVRPQNCSRDGHRPRRAKHKPTFLGWIMIFGRDASAPKPRILSFQTCQAVLCILITICLFVRRLQVVTFS